MPTRFILTQSLPLVAPEVEQLLTVPARPTTFLLVDSWRTKAALEAHSRQEYVAEYFQQLLGWLASLVAVITY